MLAISPKFFEGRKPPEEALEAPAMSDFYATHIDRALNGYSYNGQSMTGDHYWYLNFWPIRLNLPDPKGGPLPIESLDYPLWSQSDDYVFKQFEEARQAGLMSMLFTGRGFGKTYGVSSINGKGYVLNDLWKGVFSAAVDKHVNNTWDYFQESLTEMEERHPFLRRNRLLNSMTMIKAGTITYPNGMQKIKQAGQVEKILYDKEPGKTRGRRLNFQLFEEAGDWSCPATLKECLLASLGSWRVGKIVKVRAFIIGTGGSVKSPQAEELFYNPDTYSIYSVTNYENRKTGIFMPAMAKLGGFYEKTGVPEWEAAEQWLDEERAKLAGDPQAQKRFIQEFPKTPREAFEQSGAAWFNRTLLAQQQTDLIITKITPCSQRGHLMRYDESGSKGIRFIPDDEGPFYIAEEPPRDPETGRAVSMRNAYIAGLDSIDQSKIDSASPEGSKLACIVKKRQGPITQSGNMYVAAYVDRPDGPVEIAYDNVLKLLEWYDCQVNLEYSKISIVPFFRAKGAYDRFIKRPKNFLSDREKENFSTLLIGTPMNDWTKNYGIQKVRSYVEQCAYLIRFPDLIEQLLNYQPERQTEFDWVVAMMLCEIADEDMADLLPEIVVAAKPWRKFGYYTDPRTGNKKRGILPDQEEKQEMGKIKQAAQQRLQKGRVYFLEADGTPVAANPVYNNMRDW